MKIRLYYFLLSFTLLACNPNGEKLHPMVDGKNTEYSLLNTEPLALGSGVNLYIFQNKSYVWISYDYPDGSYGTLDMVIETPEVTEPLNIHVSAQLGEWPLGDESQIPKTSTSDLWWNMNGWTANNLWVNGIDTMSYDTPEFKIKNGDMREVQLAKQRFGKGEWKVKMKINGIRNTEGQFVTVSFPENPDDYHTIMVE